MSLSSALQIGRSALFASQTAIELTGNNLSNAATRGYHRQEIIIAPIASEEIANGLFVGRGVQVNQIIRRTDEALEGRIRGSIADEAGSLVREEVIGQIEALQNELTGIDLSTHMNELFNAFGELSNQPLDTSLRSLTVQRGTTLTSFIQTLRSGFADLRSQLDSRISNTVAKANSLLEEIEEINQEIVLADSGTGAAHGLRDQRDQLLSEVGKFIEISVIEQRSGAVDVYVGSQPLVLNGRSRGLAVTTDTVNGQLSQQVVIASDGTPLPANTGELGALIGLRQNEIEGAIDSLDSFASRLIYEFNRIHTQGQGTRGFTSITSENDVLDPALALNDSATGLDFPPTHGSFQLHVTQRSTGLRSTSVIDIDLDGINAAGDTTLNSLAAAIDALGNVDASVTAAGKLQISTTSGDFEISFSDDTSGVLASLGINTFFAGGDATNIAVGQAIRNNVGLVASGLGHIAGDNRNALNLVALRETPLDSIGGINLTELWGRQVESTALSLDQARRQVESDSVVRQSLEAQQQQTGGVNTDEEAINLLSFQRVFQASARFLQIVDDLMTTVLDLV